jgi:hypothetical protein
MSEQLTVDEINLYTKIVESARKIMGFPGILNKKLQELIQHRIRQLGVDLSSIKNLVKKDVPVTLASATVGIADEQFVNDTYEDNNKALEQIIAQGKRLFFSTNMMVFLRYKYVW